MEILRRQIARAHRRLVLQSLAGHLAWCWTVTLTLAVIAIGIGAIWPPLADYRLWAITCLATALGTGALAAAVWTWAGRQTALDAAAEIDHRFALKERVSSTLALAPDQLQSDAGRALVQDAASRIERIDVAEQFGVRPGRRALMPFVPAAVALALVAIIGQRVPQLPVQAATTDNAQIKKSTQALAKKLETQRRQAAAHDLPEADAILKQLEAQTKNMAEKTPADRTRALVALNDVVKEAEKRRQQLTGPAELKQQLSQLKNLQPGPADKLANAMKKANFEQAKQELDKLQDQLSGDKLTEPEKKQLGQQLDQMRQALEKMTEAHRQAEDELRKQVEAQRKSGNVAEADKLQQQLDKLAEKGPQMQKLGQMAQQLQKASESMKNGDCKQASAALGKLSNELAGMQKEAEELETLEAALDEVSDCKSAMACKECNGEGCEACKGAGHKLGDHWRRSKGGKGGGVGAGERDEAKDDTGFYDSQVKQNVRKGASVVTGLADGPNRKGQVQQEIQGDFSNAEQQTAEALSDQRLPHDYREHAKKYFDTLREGQR